MNSSDLKNFLENASRGVQDKKKQLELLKMTNRGLFELNKIFGAILFEMEEQKTRERIKNIQHQKTPDQ